MSVVIKGVSLVIEAGSAIKTVSILARIRSATDYYSLLWRESCRKMIFHKYLMLGCVIIFQVNNIAAYSNSVHEQMNAVVNLKEGAESCNKIHNQQLDNFDLSRRCDDAVKVQVCRSNAPQLVLQCNQSESVQRSYLLEIQNTPSGSCNEQCQKNVNKVLGCCRNVISNNMSDSNVLSACLNPCSANRIELTHSDSISIFTATPASVEMNTSEECRATPEICKSSAGCCIKNAHNGTKLKFSGTSKSSGCWSPHTQGICKVKFDLIYTGINKLAILLYIACVLTHLVLKLT